jgi:hypothetical protein
MQMQCKMNLHIDQFKNTDKRDVVNLHADQFRNTNKRDVDELTHISVHLSPDNRDQFT